MKVCNRERAVKSLKFQANPVPATARAIERYGLMEENDKVIKNWKALHPAIDAFCRDALSYNLENFQYDFKQFEGLTGDNLFKAKNALNKKVTTNLSVSDFFGLGKIGTLNSANFIDHILPEYIKDSDEFTVEEKTAYLKLTKDLHHLQGYGKTFLVSRVTALKTDAPKRVCENLDIYMANQKNAKTFLESEFSDAFLENYEQFQDVASLEAYSEYLTQDGIDYYNEMIGGTYDESGELVTMGYNQFVSELNSKNKSDSEYSGPFFKRLTPLNKQILMKKRVAFVVGTPKTEDDTKELFASVYDRINQAAINEVITLIQNMDPSGVYIQGNRVHTISHAAFGDHNLLKDRLENEYIENTQLELENLSQDKTLSKKERTSKRNKLKRNIGSVSIRVNESHYTIAHLSELAGEDIVPKLVVRFMELGSIVTDTFAGMNQIYLSKDHVSCRKEKVKIALVDAISALAEFNHLLRMFGDRTEDKRGDVTFYDAYYELYGRFNSSVKDFDRADKYVTAKPKDIAEENICAFGQSSKINNLWYNASEKLGFEANNVTILRILEEDGHLHYYLAESRPGAKTFVPKFLDENDSEPSVEMFLQKTSQPAIKIVGNATFVDTKAKDFFEENPDKDAFFVTDRTEKPFEITRHQYDLYKILKAKNETNIDLTPEQTKEYIDLVKRVFDEFKRFSAFEFDFDETDKYKNFSSFCAHADTFMLVNSFERVSRAQIEDLVEKGDLFLFEIYSRDMYKDKDTGNSYASKFLDILSDENMAQNLVKLNARPILTFRPACLPMPEHPTHPVGSIVVNSTDKNGHQVPEHVQHEAWLYMNGRLSKADLSDQTREALRSDLLIYHETSHDITRNYRYMKDHFAIQFSYTINAKVPANADNHISDEVTAEMRNGYNTLSVIRGVKDLIYYNLYDSNGKLLDSKSLNVVGGIDYAEKLKVLSDDRRNSKSTKLEYDKRVKSFKEAYLSEAITEIVRIAIENRAVIVIEQIDETYKNRMSKIDNQVYSTFDTNIEKRLADLRIKSAAFGEPGSFANPIQLASMKDKARGKAQNGILFRLNAAYTMSDPTTGFTNLFNMNEYNGAKNRITFIRQFDSIVWDPDLSLFVAKFDYKNFKTKLTDEELKLLNKTQWTIYFGKPRTDYDPQNKCYVYNETPWMPLVDQLTKDGMIDADLSSTELTPAATRLLFDLIDKALKWSCVKECAGNEIEYYTTVATTGDFYFSPSEVKAENLAKKFWYDFASEDKKSKKDGAVNKYLVGWLNYLSGEKE